MPSIASRFVPVSTMKKPNALPDNVGTRALSKVGELLGLSKSAGPKAMAPAKRSDVPTRLERSAPPGASAVSAPVYVPKPSSNLSAADRQIAEDKKRNEERRKVGHVREAEDRALAEYEASRKSLFAWLKGGGVMSDKVVAAQLRRDEAARKVAEKRDADFKARAVRGVDQALSKVRVGDDGIWRREKKPVPTLVRSASDRLREYVGEFAEAVGGSPPVPTPK